MAPLRKPVPTRDTKLERTGDMIQADSTNSGLQAEKLLAGTRSPPTTPPRTSDADQGDSRGRLMSAHTEGQEPHDNPSLPSRTKWDSPGSTLLRRGSSQSQNDGSAPLVCHAGRPSYVPVVRSPLNPASSESSINSQENVMEGGFMTPIESSSSGESSRHKTIGNRLISTGERKPSGALSRPQMLLRQNTAPTKRPDSPKLLGDLGRNYSRYPLPEARQNSDVRSNTPSMLESESKISLLRTTTVNPYSDSQADLHKYGYPDDSLGAIDPYLGGEKGFILFYDEIESDDKWHNPGANDDVIYKAKWRDFCYPRAIISGLGAVLLVLGLVCVFIILPILTYATNINLPGSSVGSSSKYVNTGPAWAHVNNNIYPLLRNVRKGLIDPTTPASVKTMKSTFDGSTLNLVFSDEFNDENRTFYPGDDPFWTAPNIWYGATQDMEWYDPDAVTTGGGTLQLKMDAFPNHNLGYRSGMLNSWNQMCFKGGVFEVSVSLPGPAGVPGLWPGAWTMGNLGRPGYKATTDGVWPYTYNSCDVGITPNQSSPDGLSFLPGQRLSSCTCPGADHPNPGTGRGAPEIDILEGAVDIPTGIGVVTQSYQVAPFDIFYRPNSDFMQIPNYETTQMNGYCGGPYQQAISGTTLLNNNWYNQTAYQKYAFEYIPGTSTGKIAWFVGKDQTFMVDGRAIGPNGNINSRLISQEPMSMILNLGMSGSWGTVDMANLRFPTTMHIDYVRIYQKPGQTSLTCDPPGYPTTDFIAKHGEAYNNVNLTVSSQVCSVMVRKLLMSCSFGTRLLMSGRRINLPVAESQHDTA
jgi:beta-glucanase (GH16 family)